MYGNPYQMGYQPGYMGAMPDYLSYYRNQPQMQPQPQMQSTAQPAQGTGDGNGLKWVQGEAGAKSYPVAPGSTVMLMDSESNVFYLKTVDASGMPLPLRVFDYNERTGPTAQNPSAGDAQGFDPNDFITRKEFDDKIAEITAMKQGGV